MTRKLFRQVVVVLCAVMMGTFMLAGAAAFAAEPAAAPAAKDAPKDAPKEPAKDASPVFSLKTMAGDVVTHETIKGSPAAFIFWQSACSLCRVEVEDMNNLAQMDAYKGYKIYLVNVDLNAEKVLPGYVATYKINLPILLDPDYTLGPKFGINATPGAAFISRAGKVASISKGYASDGILALKAALDALK